MITAMPWLSLAIGAGLTALGLWLLAGRHLTGDASMRWRMRLVEPNASGSRGFLLYGVTFGICSVSCTLPVFLVVVGSAVAAGGLFAVLGQFVSYAMGMALVVTVTTVAVALFKEDVLITRLRRFTPYLNTATALFVTFAGVYIVYYWLVKGRLLA